jgi:hypothetical protein
VTAVGSYIRAGHIAGNQNGVGFVRAYGWIEHCPAASGANYLEIAWACGKSCAYEKQKEKKLTGDVSHLILSFTFDIFALPLSGKAPELSTAN